MFENQSKSTVLIVGLLLFAEILGAAGQETVANVLDQPQLRTWTDRTGTHRTEAIFIELKDGKVTLRKDDGTTINVPLESLSDIDQQYLEQRAVSHEQPEKRGKVTGRPVVEINPSGGKKSARPVSPQAKEVIVTGIGTDPDKAVQNAFSQAIEQTVGLLVESETVVKNDRLIHDRDSDIQSWLCGEV